MGHRRTLKRYNKKVRYSGKMRGGLELPSSSINPVGIVTLPTRAPPPMRRVGGAAPKPAPKPAPAPVPQRPVVSCAPCPASPPMNAPTVTIKGGQDLFPIKVAIAQTRAPAAGPAPAITASRFWLTNIMGMFSYRLKALSDYGPEATNPILDNVDSLLSTPRIDLYPSFSDMKTYTFNSTIFGLSPYTYDNIKNSYATLNKIPIYFDFYMYYKTKSELNRTSIINSDDNITQNPSRTTKNRNFINSLFVLDINNIPHYFSPIFISGTVGDIPDALKIYKKKSDYMGSYQSNNLYTDASGEKSIWLDFYLNGVQSNDLDLTKLTFTAIPSKLGVPNTAYAKLIDSNGMAGTIGPVVPLAPSPAPKPSPSPSPATNPQAQAPAPA